MSDDTDRRQSDREIAAAFGDPRWAEKYPPILTLDHISPLADLARAD